MGSFSSRKRLPTVTCDRGAGELGLGFRNFRKGLPNGCQSCA